MYEFDYQKAANLGDAAKVLAANEDAKLVAGGMTLIPTLKQRLAKPSDLIDLATIDGLKGIKEEGGGVTIGAMTRHVEVNRSDIVKRVIPALAALAGMIGDPAVRNRGTIGGSISNNDPAADYPSAVVALNATVRTSKREIAGDDFFTGMFETALEPGEIVTAVRFPKVAQANYQKFRNPASRYAIVGVFVARTASGVRVAVTGAGPCVFRVPEMEAALAASFTPDALKDIAIPDDDLTTLRVPLYLVAKKTLSDDVVASLTQSIMETRRDLIGEFPVLKQISAPNTDKDDDKDTFIPIHPGAAAYFDGTQKTFLDKYGDQFMYGSMVLGSLASIFAAAWKFMTKKEEGPESLPLMRLYAFKDQLSKAGSEAELAEAEQRVDEIFKSELEKHARGDAEATDTGALGLTMQQLTNAIAQRRVALAGGDRPVPQR